VIALGAANLALRFLLELSLLAALAYWGTQTGHGVVSVLLAIAASAAAAAVWGSFVAPKARWRLHGIAWVALQFVLFGAGVAALIGTGHPVLGGMLGGAAAGNLAVLRARNSPRS
jgi:Protein of unknown function (DUF2568)